MAMDKAKFNGQFDNNMIFACFPEGCCGVTCYLLAEYLLANGIETIYVNGKEIFHINRDEYNFQSHAWLVVKDYRINKSVKRYHYKEDDIKNGLILDITGDWLGAEPIYVGYLNDFHRKYIFESAHDCEGCYDYDTNEIYQIVLKNIEDVSVKQRK